MSRMKNAAMTINEFLSNKQNKALVGATVMLARIAKGESFSAIEYITNLQLYKQAILEACPEIVIDPWFGQFFSDTEKRPYLTQLAVQGNLPKVKLASDSSVLRSKTRQALKTSR